MKYNKKIESKSVNFYSDIFDELFPLFRSITGDGIRESYKIFSRYLPLKIEGVPSGTKVFDWIVPKEWKIHGACLKGPDGKIVADINETNLRVVNYSEPVDKTLMREELLAHIYSIPEYPDLIPYVTSYYKRRWGFCLTENERKSLPPGKYRAQIDSEFVDGEVQFATCELPGETDSIILLSSNLCHPSLANNELSGPLVLLGIYDRIKTWRRRRFTYKFLLNPETIGSLCYLYKHGESLKRRLTAGLILTCTGGPSPSLSVQLSRRQNTLLNALARHLARHDPEDWTVRPFTPAGGSDERQFCSPGFDLPVGQLARTVYGTYPEYHTSGDTKEFMGIEPLIRTVDQLENFLKFFEYSGNFINTQPYGEPNLGRRGLYPDLNDPANKKFPNHGDRPNVNALSMILYVLNYSDGHHTNLDIADILGVKIRDLIPTVQKLEDNNLIKCK